MSVNDSVSGGYFDLDIERNYFDLVVSSLFDLMVDYVLVYKGRCMKVKAECNHRLTPLHVCLCTDHNFECVKSWSGTVREITL